MRPGVIQTCTGTCDHNNKRYITMKVNDVISLLYTLAAR